MHEPVNKGKVMDPKIRIFLVFRYIPSEVFLTTSSTTF